VRSYALGNILRTAIVRRRVRAAARRAVEKLDASSPLPGYVSRGREAYETLALTVGLHIPAGATILDFGSGPCDKAALLALLGYRCPACDDLEDPWHAQDGNRERIARFAHQTGVDFRRIHDGRLPFGDVTVDVVMLLNVREHLHDSPRPLLQSLLDRVRPGGHLLVTVPNAVNLRKRIAVLRGRTSLPPFAPYFQSSPPWRGHVREYVRDDLSSLARLLGLETVGIRRYHRVLWRLRPRWRLAYRGATALIPGGRDSLLLLACKPKAPLRPA
jgi:SAM-dependent methyltransferase